MARFRFSCLLLALLLMFLLAPLTKVLSGANHAVLTSVIFSVLILTAVVSVSQRRRSIVIAASLALPGLVMQALLAQDAFVGESGARDPLLLLWRDWLMMAFLLYSVVLIMRHVFTPRTVTFDTIAAALCAYLLLGFIWALAYEILELHDPTVAAFSRELVEENTSFYFSIVTLTTLGYGDITPNTPLARTLVSLEALIGQMYLTVLVAWLVGMYIAHSGTGARKPSE